MCTPPGPGGCGITHSPLQTGTSARPATRTASARRCPPSTEARLRGTRALSRGGRSPPSRCRESRSCAGQARVSTGPEQSSGREPRAARFGELEPALLADLDAEIATDGTGRGVGRVRGPDERPRSAHNVQTLPHLQTGPGVSTGSARLPPASQHSPWPPPARSPCT